MDSLSYLKPLIGKQRTLVVTCEECGMELGDNGNDHVFTYSSLGNILQRNDYLQQESIRYYIEGKGCSQLIIAGHACCKVIRHILNDKSFNSPLAALRFSLQTLLKNNHAETLREKIRETMLVELNVIQQSNLLMEYDFIRKRVEEGFLNVIGLVAYAHTEESKQIFYNGITFNDLISLN